MECRRRKVLPWSLVIALTLALTLTVLPQSWLEPVKGWALASLRPGQRAVAAAASLVAAARTRVASHFAGAAELAASQKEIERLTTQNRRLSRRLEGLERRIAAVDAEQPRAEHPLLTLSGIEARVLGWQARSYLARRQLLDVGSFDGVEPGALVLDGAAIVDRGQEHGLLPGQLALDAGHVWGRVVGVGPNVAVIRTLTAPGFRDVVRLRSPRGPEGILEGSGEPLCRIRMVAVTEPVAPGDEVLSGSLAGLETPLPRYGVIERVERPIGAPHWDIWMRPARTASPPDRVVVVRVAP